MRNFEYNLLYFICRRGDYIPHPRVVDADFRRAERTPQAPLPHLRPHHGRSKQSGRGPETREGHQRARRHPRPPAGPPPEHPQLHGEEPAVPDHRRGGPHPQHRVRGGDEEDREAAAQEAADDAVQRDDGPEDGEPDQAGAEEGADLRGDRGQGQGRRGDGHRAGAGLRHLPVRQAAAAALHLPEEEPQEEGDGVLLVVHVGQVPRRALQLHRPAGYEHTRKQLVN